MCEKVKAKRPGAVETLTLRNSQCARLEGHPTVRGKQENFDEQTDADGEKSALSNGWVLVRLSRSKGPKTHMGRLLKAEISPHDQ
jgi:hypothetical protein